MSDEVEVPTSSNQVEISDSDAKRIIIGAFSAVAVLVGVPTGCNSYKVVPPHTYGLGVTMGNPDKTLMEPGFHWKQPWGRKIFIYPNNTQTAEFTVGGGRDENTSDRNGIDISIRVIYDIDPRVGTISFHLKELQDNGGSAGESLLQSLAEKSLKTVLGPRPALDTLANPKEVLEKFNTDFRGRLSRNNVAVKIQRIEFLVMDASISKPLQMMVDDKGIAQQAIGTAAVEVGGSPKSSTTIVATPIPADATQSVAPGPVPQAPVLQAPVIK